MKTCISCKQEKPLLEFYANKGMADGHLNKCKDCVKNYERQRRNGPSRTKILEYDRKRGSSPDRVQARALYSKTEAYRASHANAVDKYRKSNPARVRATAAVNNALRAGKLQKMPCIVCGSSKVHAHHPYYDPPLDVVWLCPDHHKQTHALVKDQP